jgi:hypothetical protein
MESKLKDKTTACHQKCNLLTGLKVGFLYVLAQNRKRDKNRIAVG